MSVFNDRLLFIHIPKCAGTSCRDYLLQHLPGAVDSLAQGGPLPIDSVPLRHIEEYTGRSLDSWERIVIPLRDPYAQAVSHWSYHWDRFARGGRHVHDLTAAIHKSLTDWLLDPLSDFRLWYEQAVRGQPLQQAAEIVDASGFFEYYCAIDGEVPPNVVLLKTEDIAATFPEAVAPFVEDAGAFPHSHRSPHRSDKTMEYFTSIATKVVRHRYRWAFDAGHYEERAL